jgi:aminodeoxyfutalosine deaminase
MAAWTLRAHWVFPVSSPPLKDGTVTVEGDRIVAVEPSSDRTPHLDLGHAAVLPGLVNAHTHLDLTGMKGLAPPSADFPGWLRQVIGHRRGRSPEQVQADIRAGLGQCLRFGTTLIGDISGDGSSWDLVKDAPLRSIIYRELLGLTAERAIAAWNTAEEWLAVHPATETCRPGLSPHAPYSVRRSLYQTAAARGAPLATHLAESQQERELLARHQGPFVEFLQALGVWDPGGLVTGGADVLQVCSGSPLVLAHGNYLPDDTAIPPEATIVYCPRTHAAFGHPPHPFREFLARGVRVALGTDSLASNPDLDLLAEARFVRRLYPDLPGDVLLRTATLSGAEALGWQAETGSLTPGKSADLVVLPLSEKEEEDPYRLLFNSAQTPRAVLWRGRWVHDAAGVLRSSSD